jgi:putative ABC transport system permease protein
MQFLSDQLLYPLSRLLFAILIVELSLPYIIILSQRNLQLPLFTNVCLLYLILAGTLIIGVLSGFILSAYLVFISAGKSFKRVCANR